MSGVSMGHGKGQIVGHRVCKGGHVEKYQDVRCWLGKGWTLGQQREVVPVKPQSERD